MAAPVRITCMRVMRLLQSFLDGEVDDTRAEYVASHLRWCRRCGPEAEVMRRVIDAIRRVRPDLDLSLYDRLAATVEGFRDGSDG